MLTVNLVKPAGTDGTGENESTVSMMSVFAIHAEKKIVGEGRDRRSITSRVQLDFHPKDEIPSTIVEKGYVYVLNDEGKTIHRIFVGE